MHDYTYHFSCDAKLDFLKNCQGESETRWANGQSHDPSWGIQYRRELSDIRRKYAVLRVRASCQMRERMRGTLKYKSIQSRWPEERPASLQWVRSNTSQARAIFFSQELGRSGHTDKSVHDLSMGPRRSTDEIQGTLSGWELQVVTRPRLIRATSSDPMMAARQNGRAQLREESLRLLRRTGSPPPSTVCSMLLPV